MPYIPAPKGEVLRHHGYLCPEAGKASLMMQKWESAAVSKRTDLSPIYVGMLKMGSQGEREEK